MLTVAMPMPRPRLPIQRTDVPLKVNEAVAPVELDCMAEPPLQPERESLRVHAPLKVTKASDSSTRMPAVGTETVGVPPPDGAPTAGPEPPPPPPPPQEANR